jgi:hypothetical protein
VDQRQQLAEEEGGSLSSEDASRLLQISKTDVLKRLDAGRLLAWREERLQAARFPRWQFDEHGQVLAGLEEVLTILNQDERLDAWGKILFFLQEKGSLGDRRPLDLLREGRLKEVCLAATRMPSNPKPARAQLRPGVDFDQRVIQSPGNRSAFGSGCIKRVSTHLFVNSAPRFPSSCPFRCFTWGDYPDVSLGAFRDDVFRERAISAGKWRDAASAKLSS